MPIRLCLACPAQAHYRGYCIDHAKTKEQQTNRKGRHIYGTAKWRNTRKAVLSSQPLCKCGEIAVDVDHIVPLPEGDPYDPANLQGLCKSCHAKKTRREQTSGVGWPD